MVEGCGSRASEAGSGGGEVDPAAAALRWVQQARGWARWAYPWVFSFFFYFINRAGQLGLPG